MKALTLWQPWAGAIRCGAKKYETRSWPTSYRGEIAIHASKHVPTGALEIEAAYQATRTILAGPFDQASLYPRGAIIALANLVRIWETDALLIRLGPLSQTEHDLGDFSDGRFAWEVENVRPIDPVLCRGAQGLWNVSEQVEEYIRRRLIR